MLEDVPPTSKQLQIHTSASQFPQASSPKPVPPSQFIIGELVNPRNRYTETWKKIDDLGIPHELVLMKDGRHPFWNDEQWFDDTVDVFDGLLTKQSKNSRE